MLNLLVCVLNAQVQCFCLILSAWSSARLGLDLLIRLVLSVVMNVKTVWMTRSTARSAFMDWLIGETVLVPALGILLWRSMPLGAMIVLRTVLCVEIGLNCALLAGRESSCMRNSALGTALGDLWELMGCVKTVLARWRC